MSATYHLFSLATQEEYNVGIWLFTQDIVGQPVRLRADLVEWKATPRILGGGPTQLSPSPYPATREHKGEVFAINDPSPESSQLWFLIPANEEGTYLIATGPRPTKVWTAEEPGDPIKIKDFQLGSRNQVFRFVPARE